MYYDIYCLYSSLRRKFIFSLMLWSVQYIAMSFQEHSHYRTICQIKKLRQTIKRVIL